MPLGLFYTGTQGGGKNRCVDVHFSSCLHVDMYTCQSKFISTCWVSPPLKLAHWCQLKHTCEPNLWIMVAVQYFNTISPLGLKKKIAIQGVRGSTLDGRWCSASLWKSIHCRSPFGGRKRLFPMLKRPYSGSQNSNPLRSLVCSVPAKWHWPWY